MQTSALKHLRSWPLLEAAIAKSDLVSVSAPCPRLDVQSMVETVNVGLEQLAEGLDC